MDKLTLDKANELSKDIQVIDKVIEANRKGNWVAFSTPDCGSNIFISARFQKELAEFVLRKRLDYSKELGAL